MSVHRPVYSYNKFKYRLIKIYEPALDFHIIGCCVTHLCATSLGSNKYSTIRIAGKSGFYTV